MSNRQPTSRQNREPSPSNRADRFWSAFRFTENGKPKSSLILYTFCLSVAFAAVYALCYEAAIHWLTAPLGQLPARLSNGIIALLSSAVGACLCCLPHRFFKDKRLVFGGHLWLCGYAAAVLLTMLALMGFTEAFGAFLVFFGWAIAVPVAVGTGFAAFLFRRDRGRSRPAEQEPEWKKFVNHHS